MRRLQRQIHVHRRNSGHPSEHLLDPGRTGRTSHACDIKIRRFLKRIVAKRADLLFNLRQTCNRRVKAHRRLLQCKIHIGPRHPLHPRQPFLNPGRAGGAGHACNLQCGLLQAGFCRFFHSLRTSRYPYRV
ncbi:hypothetical protein D3C81_1491330 [compost metagenome]